MIKHLRLFGIILILGWMFGLGWVYNDLFKKEPETKKRSSYHQIVLRNAEVRKEEWEDFLLTNQKKIADCLFDEEHREEQKALCDAILIRLLKIDPESPQLCPSIETPNAKVL